MGGCLFNKLLNSSVRIEAKFEFNEYFIGCGIRIRFLMVQGSIILLRLIRIHTLECFFLQHINTSH